MVNAPLPRSAQGVIQVDERIFRRIIRKHRGMSGLGLTVVHDQCYVLPRADLARLAPELVGPHVTDFPILVPSGRGSERDVFHGLVHRAIEKMGLSEAQLRKRIHAIGQTEFDEIRFVLRQDELLLPPRDDRETYTEFAARYLELLRYEPTELHRSFPSLVDHEEIRLLLMEDVGELAEAAPAPEPEPAPAPAPAPQNPDDETTTTSAVSSEGNVARQAIFAVRDGRVGDARAGLHALAARLELPEPGWAAALLPLARVAARQPRRRSVEARLLYDLVKAATDRERDQSDIDLADWAWSLGRRPLIRPLPAVKPVRLVKHLRHAVAKLPQLRVTDGERARLGALLRAAHERAAEVVRHTFGPQLEAVLDDVKLVASSVPERVARRKLVAELLDRVVERGYLSVGHLRDAIAGNGLKLPDLDGPLALWRGDALLRADARLAVDLDGVYRRGEIYLRGLQKLSSLFFATRPGRALTLYALLPLVAAYVVLSGAEHIVGPIAHALAGVHPEIFTWPRFGVLTAIVFALLHSSRVRAGALAAARATGRGLHAVFVTAPRAVWHSGPVQAVVTSRLFKLAAHWLFKPAVAAGVVVLGVRLFHADGRTALLAGALGFVVLNILQLTRAWQVIEEVVLERAVATYRLALHRILPGLVRLLLDLFSGLVELLDRALVAVDEKLRFRRGEGRLTVAIKALLGTLWAVVTYLVRIYVNLLAEPTINPIKHFPVVTVAGKIMLPLTPTILRGITDALSPLVGGVVGGSVAGATLLVLPGFWGFLVWELKENWRLYAANRARELGPVIVGSHGETVGRLLRPGLHSGTVPKAFHKLRRAARRGGPGVLRQRAALHHVEEAVVRFVDRELVVLLEEAGVFPRGALRVDGVHAASNRLRVHLTLDGRDAVLAFEEQSGWIVAGVPEPGWIATLPDETRAAWDRALRGLYRLAGVDLVRADIERSLGPQPVPYDIADEGLVVWPDGFHAEVVMPLPHDREPVTWQGWVRSW